MLLLWCSRKLVLSDLCIPWNQLLFSCSTRWPRRQQKPQQPQLLRRRWRQWKRWRPRRHKRIVGTCEWTALISDRLYECSLLAPFAVHGLRVAVMAEIEVENRFAERTRSEAMKLHWVRRGHFWLVMDRCQSLTWGVGLLLGKME